MDHETARLDLRVRLDECDGTRTARPGVLFSLADEARFALYDQLVARHVVLPRRHAVRAESLRVLRSPASREALVVTAHVGRVGRTSYDIVHRAATPAGEPLFALVSTLVGLVEGVP